MASRFYRTLVLIFLASASVSISASQENKPLTDTELLSLVAGNALPENIAQDIQSRGLAFQPFAAYRSLLTDSAANSLILDALDRAKTSNTTANVTPSEVLQHLAAAGKFIRSKQFEDATRELADAAESNNGPEVGFVMGEVLRRQYLWSMAVSVYQEVLQRNPDFREAHTKLSYVLTKSGNP